jgi:hypothetical protein
MRTTLTMTIWTTMRTKTKSKHGRGVWASGFGNAKPILEHLWLARYAAPA